MLDKALRFPPRLLALDRCDDLGMHGVLRRFAYRDQPTLPTRLLRDVHIVHWLITTKFFQDLPGTIQEGHPLLAGIIGTDVPLDTWDTPVVFRKAKICGPTWQTGELVPFCLVSRLRFFDRLEDTRFRGYVECTPALDFPFEVDMQLNGFLIG